MEVGDGDLHDCKDSRFTNALETTEAPENQGIGIMAPMPNNLEESVAQ